MSNVSHPDRLKEGDPFDSLQSLPAGAVKAQKPLDLLGRQRALHIALVEKNEHLGNMYIGALTALQNDSNPERLSQVAHSLRELMEKMPAYMNLPVKVKSETLGMKVREFSCEWKKVRTKSEHHRNPEWSEQVDGPLRKFLKKTEEFFLWFEQHRPKRKDQVALTLRALDPMGRPLPLPLEKLRVDEWEKIRDYFVGVAHHQIGAIHGEFISRLDALEVFLLDRLRPRTFADHDTIDSIIREGESHA